ncbi:unnamed protein product [Clonostachys rosea f. rosea IK726]|uniref:J domain-containing protein n=2 Tax=Bionectria ochroleuca TaxID=29856 RepID=A0A0B7KPK8_BIOOC|nr:unnamed protein product [Clonostachys rosea f. rosea IK726]
MATATETTTNTTSPLTNGQQPSPPIPQGSSTTEDQAQPEEDYSRFRFSEEAFKESDRILQCDPSDYYSILGVPNGTNENDTTASFKKLGFLIHPFEAEPDDMETDEAGKAHKAILREHRFKECNEQQKDDALKAFHKLLKAAGDVNVNEVYIDQVKDWGGEQDDLEDKSTLPQDSLEKPPPNIISGYADYTYIYKIYADAPEVTAFRNQLDIINNTLRKLYYGEKTIPVHRGKEVPCSWEIPLSKLEPHLKTIKQLSGDPGAEVKLRNANNLVKMILDKHHLPEEWGNPRDVETEYYHLVALELRQTLERKLQGISSQANGDMNQSQKAKEDISLELQSVVQCQDSVRGHLTFQNGNPEPSEITEAKKRAIEELKKGFDAMARAEQVEKDLANIFEELNKRPSYPWAVLPIEDGARIIGYRPVGRGCQVLTERREKSGILIHRLEPAHEVGRESVAKYRNMDGAKKLTRDRKWSSKDKDNFIKIHWSAKSQVKLHNLALGKPRSPDNPNYVEFTHGMHVLWYTEVEAILGMSDAQRDIRKVCERDGIIPPWESKPAGTIYDPSKQVKGVSKRRARREELPGASGNHLNQMTQAQTQHMQPSAETQSLTERVTRLEQGFDQHRSDTNVMMEMMQKITDMQNDMRKAMERMISHIPS